MYINCESFGNMRVNNNKGLFRAGVSPNFPGGTEGDHQERKIAFVF